MTELKTLKDIRKNVYDDEYGIVEGEYEVDYDFLRQEAIKWIKNRIANCFFSCRNNIKRCKEHTFWMKRFDITEEELK